MYPSFAEFMRVTVLPLQAANPDHVRLDGATAGGNRTVWRVHSDTHFQPLLVAYAAAERDTDPFTERPTKTTRCLELLPELQDEQESDAKNLYMYADGPHAS